MRPAWAEVDLDALAANVRAMARAVSPAHVCAVVKADAYGHGAVPVATTALRAGATHLAVALVEEGVELREAGITAPVLVLSEPPSDELPTAAAHDLSITLYTEPAVGAAEAAATKAAGTVAVHLKVDTGMSRVGAHPRDALRLARLVESAEHLRLEALWTHCAVADDPSRPDTDEQLRTFSAVLGELQQAGITPPLVHAANSAAAIAFPGSRFSMVRAGIALYGIPPSGDVSLPEVRPVMSVKARVSYVKTVAAGTGVSYGHHWHAPAETVIATVPMGYADGVRRALGLRGGEVLIGGRRRAIAGVVTMDQLMVDCGDDRSVAVGDEVVLLGCQGDCEITATEWADKVDTIGYEIVCGIGPRVPRRYVGEGV